MESSFNKKSLKFSYENHPMTNFKLAKKCVLQGRNKSELK